MPRPRDEVSAPPAQLPTGGGPMPPPLSADPIPLPPRTFGLKGGARWQALVEHNMFLFSDGLGGHDYSQWVLGLPEDPSDPEFNIALRAAKDRARQKEPRPSVDPLKPGPASFSASGEETKPDTAPGPSTLSPLTPDTGREEQTREYRERSRQDAVAAYEQPVFRGRPVNSTELYDPTGPGLGTPAPTLDEWLSEQGIVLPGNDRSKALRSGEYVYMGKERNEKLGADRDVYMYLPDANAAGQRVDPNQLAGYQKALGLAVNGKMDPILQNYWDEAVKQARNSAITGIKMSVQEWFDLIMASVIAQKNASGGGGGGGGGGPRKEEFDYYREMMAVLGDISGVEG